MLKVNGISFKGAESTINNFSSVSQPVNQKQDISDKKMSTKTKVMIGTGLAALAAVGIYIATKGRAKTNVNVNTNKVSDIIEEGIGFNGCKYKKIKDGASKHWKEYITYYKDGKENSHIWYDCSVQDIKDIEKSITKEIQYAENGDIFTIKSYMAPGKPSKLIQYNSSEDIKKYGYKICTGTKFYPNGNKRFEMVNFQSFGLVSAWTYDIDGKLIKRRDIVIPTIAKSVG